jgi:membrane protein DedA with SNARE-associated domain
MSQQVERRRLPWKGITLGVLTVVVTVALCVVVVYYKDALMSVVHIEKYGLLGVFIFAFIAGSVVNFVATPFPYWLLVFTMPSILAPSWGALAPLWVGLISALGASLGQLLTFMVGYSGSRIYHKFTVKIDNRFYNRAIGWAQRHGSWAVFAMSALFNPVHLPMTLAIAALRYPPLKFYIFSLLGNMVKSLFIAYCGYFGLTSLFNFFGL